MGVRGLKPSYLVTPPTKAVPQFLNPLTPKISSVIPLTVFLTVFVMLVWRIWQCINLLIFFILITFLLDTYMLFTRQEVHTGKNYAWGLRYGLGGYKTEGTVFLNFSKTSQKVAKRTWIPVSGPDGENAAFSQNQSDCRICRIPPAHGLRKK